MTLTIQAGKYYRIRHGRKVGPLTFQKNSNTWQCPNFGLTWKLSGDTVFPHCAYLDLIAEWTEEMTNASHIIPSANGRTYDLTALETPFGLLPEDVQRALRAWEHGLEHWRADHWAAVLPATNPASSFTYRARPAPKATEHVLWWRAGHSTAHCGLSVGHHKITISYTGDTPPCEVFTAPSGATITVEKAE